MSNFYRNTDILCACVSEWKNVNDTCNGEKNTAQHGYHKKVSNTSKAVIMGRSGRGVPLNHFATDQIFLQHIPVHTHTDWQGIGDFFFPLSIFQPAKVNQRIHLCKCIRLVNWRKNGIKAKYCAVFIFAWQSKQSPFSCILCVSITRMWIINAIVARADNGLTLISP